MDIGTKLKTIREARKLSVYRLSKLADISENHIHAIEKNKNQPSVLILEKLLSQLGVSLAEFFSESDDIVYPTEYERNLLNSVRTLDEKRADAVLVISELLHSDES